MSPNFQFWPLNTCSIQTPGKHMNSIIHHGWLRFYQLIFGKTHFCSSNYRWFSIYPWFVENIGANWTENFHFWQNFLNHMGFSINKSVTNQNNVTDIGLKYLKTHLKDVMFTWLYLKSSKSKVSTSKVVNV